jgi:hypothetical protein
MYTHYLAFTLFVTNDVSNFVFKEFVISQDKSRIIGFRGFVSAQRASDMQCIIIEETFWFFETY